MKRVLLYLLIPCIFPLSAGALDVDSIKGDLLNEVVVTAENQRMNATSSSYIPTSKEKNAAQSGVMLLGLMAIPQLDVDMSSLSVKTMGGDKVTIFVDYIEASPQDLEGMRTRDVKRVEFYSHPMDMRFKGVAYAVNFIMQKYEYGGYTKLKAEKQFGVNRTEASVYSKLAHRSMIYDIYADDYYLTDRHSGSDKSEIFRFPDLFGEGPLEVARNSTAEASRYRNNINNLAVRALYNSQKMQLSNRVGLNLSHTPLDNSSNQVIYHPEIFKSDVSQRALSSKNLTASYNGDFFFALSPKSTFQTEVRYSYGRNSSNSRYVSADQFSITNDALENLHDLHVNPRFSYQLNGHNRLMAYGSGVVRHNLIDYSGSAASTQKYNVQAYFFGLHYDYFSPRVQAGGELGWAWEKNKIGYSKS